jgi:DnaJ-class molecular chaperone
MAQIEILKGKKFKCAFCGGTGIQPLSLKGRCAACKGARSVEFEGLTIRCPYCEGRGKAYRSSALSCLICSGLGAIQIKEPYEICPKCKGNAREIGTMLYCGRCHGRGIIEKGCEQEPAKVVEERLEEITKKLKKVRKETEKKTKEIEKRLKPVKPFIKEVEKESLWLKKLGNKIKKGWKSLWEQ